MVGALTAAGGGQEPSPEEPGSSTSHWVAPQHGVQSGRLAAMEDSVLTKCATDVVERPAELSSKKRLTSVRLIILGHFRNSPPKHSLLDIVCPCLDYVTYSSATGPH